MNSDLDAVALNVLIHLYDIKDIGMFANRKYHKVSELLKELKIADPTGNLKNVVYADLANSGYVSVAAESLAINENGIKFVEKRYKSS
ncbi:hypothetical protein [Rufibacter latericius]|uniref:Uncharacterized protein n=1 Tax=Rufibacter latericius TaxID=2487040 RepID=A0A3M9MM59_9BACT|nr:hypothetical protein [Rufibacter latericius]RNI26624.1 hypothetical protein EFB08_11440 [Rufibacter latericius]